ncbi:MAG: amidohydrolase [Pseudonocardiales bacterium]|nr:MAG: amidohydrolase [Pseudonocardiales bacterium]
MSTPEPDASAVPSPWLDQWLTRNCGAVVALRRQLHAHPELGRREYVTTELIRSRLAAAGLSPRVLPLGTGVVCDVGTFDGPGAGPVIALRADIDALPVLDVKEVSYRSTVEGLSHACGHDVHTAILLGTALALAASPEPLPGRVRLVFQPAEELTPGGSLDVIAADGLDAAEWVFCLHCDPRLPTGSVGLRSGPITAAADMVEVYLSGPGGHTARPHLTADLIYALGRVITDVPGLLSRVVDPRAGLSLVWGEVQAGRAANAIPQTGVLRGTVRVLDRDAWARAPELVRRLVAGVIGPTGITAEVEYVRGVPPVDNDPHAIELLRAATVAGLGAAAVADTPQSLGGEDFGWYLEKVPGALARLGVAGPGMPSVDLHQGAFDIDEGAIEVGVRLLVQTAYTALRAC